MEETGEDEDEDEDEETGLASEGEMGSGAQRGTTRRVSSRIFPGSTIRTSVPTPSSCVGSGSSGPRSVFLRSRNLARSSFVRVSLHLEKGEGSYE